MDTGDSPSEIEPQPHTQDTSALTEISEPVDSLESVMRQLPSFKPRPLFCVVCASNQVSFRPD
jgi:hypothetical protein